MKKIALLMVVALVACLTVAPVLAHEGHGTMDKKKDGHDVTVEVVSMDMKANTLTIKDENGKMKTVPVMGEAVKQLSNVKAGEKVTVTCWDNENGEHQGITHIKTGMAKTEKK